MIFQEGKKKIEPNVEFISSLNLEKSDIVEVSDISKPKKKKKKKKEKQEDLKLKKEDISEVEHGSDKVADKVVENVTAVVATENVATVKQKVKAISDAPIFEEKIEAVINESLDLEPPILEIPEVKPDPEPTPDEASIILEALNTLDYEPVLADSVLEILVGKAANREKATMATISRLENAMASVVNEVQKALEHHNYISKLVSKSKDMAQQISQSTDKNDAKASLSELIGTCALACYYVFIKMIGRSMKHVHVL